MYSKHTIVYSTYFLSNYPYSKCKKNCKKSAFFVQFIKKYAKIYLFLFHGTKNRHELQIMSVCGYANCGYALIIIWRKSV